jgi:tRNA threonylcarbamoyladenosine biosynthesis protein TsaE
VTWQATTRSAEETEALAERLAKGLKGGEVIELVSDLGGGKTTFVRGLMRGLGSDDKVASPTFTISKMYAAGSLTVHHFDFYRLHEPGIIADELAEVVSDPGAIAVVEWADVVQHVLPENRVTIRILQTPEGNRQLTFHYPASLHALMEKVEA